MAIRQEIVANTPCKLGDPTPTKARARVLSVATQHDLRRTCLTTITRLGFGRNAMDRIANHRTSSVTDVYDRHGYQDEDRRLLSTVERHVLGVVVGPGRPTSSALR